MINMHNDHDNSNQNLNLNPTPNINSDPNLNSNLNQIMEELDMRHCDYNHKLNSSNPPDSTKEQNKKVVLTGKN